MHPVSPIQSDDRRSIDIPRGGTPPTTTPIPFEDEAALSCVREKENIWPESSRFPLIFSLSMDPLVWNAGPFRCYLMRNDAPRRMIDYLSPTGACQTSSY